MYKERDEDGFIYDNGFKVISRKYRGKELFNFKDKNGKIISDIDFNEVLPFDGNKDMTARGYTPNRRCYIVFEDAARVEVNESSKCYWC